MPVESAPGAAGGPGRGAPQPFPPHLPQERTQSYFRSRYQGLHVERAAKPPVVDGLLADWDPAGFFASACSGELGRQHFLLGAMRADDQALYIGAVVGDPFPMRNAVPVGPNPTTEPPVWEGGAIHVYLALRSIPRGQPLPAAAAQQADGQLVRLTLWYSRPDPKADGVPRLMVSQTMNDGGRTPAQFHVVGADQFAAAYRPLDDGRTGYALEYRIPWKALNVGLESTPFQNETVSRGCWEVHWSDATGTAFRGKLVEVVNSGNEKHAYETADAWGELYFHSLH